jgi:uncharacterized protein (DUF983 family)
MKPFFKKGNVLYGILKFKCPHCHEGDFFDGFPPKATVNKSCEVCDRKLSLEPGFYQGSYYVTYALGVDVLVACWLIISVFSLDNIYDLMILVGPTSIILCAPIMYPMSKIIWANMFMGFKQINK